jgi:hypothetical protein
VSAALDGMRVARAITTADDRHQAP